MPWAVFLASPLSPSPNQFIRRVISDRTAQINAESEAAPACIYCNTSKWGAGEGVVASTSITEFVLVLFFFF